MKIYEVSSLDVGSFAHNVRNGEVFVYPTDTVAGIGAIGNHQQAVTRLFEIKNRELTKSVSYAFYSLEMVKKFTLLPVEAERMMNDLLPGALTVILKKREDAPYLYGSDMETLGVRIPQVPWLLELIKQLEFPVITTSANLAGQPTARSVDEISPEILTKIDSLIRWPGILDSEASTIVSFVGSPKIIRQGAISFEVLMPYLEDLS